MLPQHHIATKPVYPATKARLLIYDRQTGQTIHETFENIMSYLPDNLSVYLNDTKVIKARIYGQKPTGGKVELLVLRYIDKFHCMVYIKGKVHANTQIKFQDGLVANILEVSNDGSKIVEFIRQNHKLTFTDLVGILEHIGHIPLPSYIKRADDTDDTTDYQTIFAKHHGAVASPTASLHFDEKLFESFRHKYDLNYLTLHIGAGTFKPVDVDDIRDFAIHREVYEIPDKTIKALQNKQNKNMCIGTTVTRTLEYYYKTKQPHGLCDLFLHPLNPPQITDILLTNFHLPKSTLIMLVASFVGVQKTMKLYKDAIDRGYRFYSYGDAMLVL